MSAILSGIDKRFHSRKFQLAAAAFLAGLAFFALRYMTAAEWVEYTRWIVGLYMLGNVGDTAAEKLR